MVRESLLLPTINLTNEQWMIVDYVCAILAPLKFVQKIMEGEKYVTVVVESALPGLRAVPDLVPIHPILPPTVHIHL